MKKIISVIICIIFFSLIGCENIDNEKTINTFNDKELKVYSSKDSQKVKDLLKSYGEAKNLTVEKAKKNNMVVVENEQIVGNKKIWDDFYNNSKNNREGSILIVQYTEQDDPILTYLSYKDKEFFMIEDDSRDQYRDSKNEDYFEYSFKYLKLFEENNKTYVYLLDDNEITLDELNYSLLSANISDWIPYGFVFYYINT